MIYSKARFIPRNPKDGLAVKKMSDSSFGVRHASAALGFRLKSSAYTEHPVKHIFPK